MFLMKKGTLKMFNEKLKAQLATTRSKLGREIGVKGKLVDFIQGYRMQLANDLRKEQSKKNPLDKKIYAINEKSHLIAEIQNRILDNEF